MEIFVKAYLVPLSLICSSYVLMPDYRHSSEKKPFEMEGYYRQAKSANVTTKPYKGSKMKIMEYDAGASYNFKINEENFVSFGLGTFHQTLNWDQNPVFKGHNYDYVVGSLGVTSNSIENWRWSGATVLSFQTQNFGIKDSGWISVLFWGEYFISKKAHFHAGFWGYTGVRNVYFLPILGFSYKTNHSEIAAVFPFDIAIRYKPVKQFHLEVAGKWFGGPYRFPQRMNHGFDGYDKGIFQLFTPTTELGAYYHPTDYIDIGASIGYSYGGWLMVVNKGNHHKQYYNFDGSIYWGAAANFRF